MKKLIYSLVFFILFQSSFSQNWEIIKTDSIYNFLNSNNEFIAYRIDSIRQLNKTENELFNYPNSKLVNSFCISTKYSWLGKKIWINNSENTSFINKNNDTILIKSNQKINACWKFCKLNDTLDIYANVISINKDFITNLIDSCSGCSKLDSVLESQKDSICTINLQVKNKKNTNVNHSINGKTIKLSKNNGIITLMDFYDFPTELKEYSLTLKKPLTHKEVFNYSIGDEFHIEDFSSSFFGTYGHTRKTILYVLSKKTSINKDTLTYSYKRIAKYQDYNKPITYYNDTIKEIIILSNYKDELPLKPYLKNSSFYKNEYLNRKSDFNNLRILAANFSDFSYNTSNDTCYLPLLVDGGSYNYCLDGCGCFSNSYSLMGLDESYVRLKYYKKNNNQEWGTPFNKNELVSTNEVKLNKNVIISPNPVKDILYIHLTDEKIEYISIVTIKGSLIFDQKNGSNNINIENIPTGTYFINITTNKNTYIEKIVKE